MRKAVLLVLLSMVLVGPTEPVRADETPPVWRVCVGDQVVLPYLSNDPDKPGLAERLMVKAGNLAGLSVQLLRYPIKRCSALFDGGEVDSVIRAPLGAHLQRFQFPLKGDAVDAGRRLARINIVWVRRAETRLDWDGQRFHGLLDVTAKPLIGSRAALGAATLPLLAQGYQVDDGATTTEQALAKLNGRRVEVVVGLQEEIEAALRDPKLQGLIVMEHPFSVSDYHVVVRKNLPPAQQVRVEAWWTAVGRLRDTAEFKPR